MDVAAERRGDRSEVRSGADVMGRDGERSWPETMKGKKSLCGAAAVLHFTFFTFPSRFHSIFLSGVFSSASYACMVLLTFIVTSTFPGDLGNHFMAALVLL